MEFAVELKLVEAEKAAAEEATKEELKKAEVFAKVEEYKKEEKFAEVAVLIEAALEEKDVFKEDEAPKTC